MSGGGKAHLFPLTISVTSALRINSLAQDKQTNSYQWFQIVSAVRKIYLKTAGEPFFVFLMESARVDRIVFTQLRPLCSFDKFIPDRFCFLPGLDNQTSSS